MITSISSAEVLTTTHRFLGVSDGGSVGRSYLAAALRRLAGTVCPCSPKTLVRAMVDCHRGLVDDAHEFSEKVEVVIDDLISIGDLLEINDVAAIDELIRGTWVFAAPPSFVMHLGNVAQIIGLSSDEQTPLPAEVRDRVRLEGVTRRLYPKDNEDLRNLLLSLGLREIYSEVWLRFPKVIPAKDLVDRADRQLSELGPSGTLDGARIFDHLSEHRGYRSRWEPLKRQTGRFIVRRPQPYGADRWGYGEVSGGEVCKLLEFPDSNDRRRACDIAWRLAMALKALAGSNVTYRLIQNHDFGSFDFHFPLPDWAKRSLAFAGQQVEPRGCLLSFDIAVGQVPSAEQFLKSYLFLSPATIDR
ncbi:hypothetical protein AAIH70_25930 [Neorhizobium sp. BT27B]|uniref:hypothetical protein n=1 Tax=Neorhizobium sp. BT27B TaxID=3142625 RepID=UPI003D2D28E7